MSNALEDMRNEAARYAKERVTVAHIKSVMKSFGVTIERAMEALKIPEGQWEDYARLVEKHTL